MQQEVAFKSIDIIRAINPGSTYRNGVFVLSETEGSTFVVAPMWSNNQKNDMLIGFELYLPTFSFIKKGRKAGKLLDKAQEIFAGPKGFHVQANPNVHGGIDVWISSVWETPLDKKSFLILADEMRIVALAVYQLFVEG